MNSLCSHCSEPYSTAQPDVCTKCFLESEREFIDTNMYEDSQMTSSTDTNSLIVPPEKHQVSLFEYNVLHEIERVRRAREEEALVEQSITQRISAKLKQQQQHLRAIAPRRDPLDDAVGVSCFTKTKAIHKCKMNKTSLSHHQHRLPSDSDDEEEAPVLMTEAPCTLTPSRKHKVTALPLELQQVAAIKTEAPCTLTRSQKRMVTALPTGTQQASSINTEDPCTLTPTQKRMVTALPTGTQQASSINTEAPCTLTPSQKRMVTALPKGSQFTLIAKNVPVVTSICQELLPEDPTTHEKTLLVKMITVSYALVNQTLSETLIAPDLLQEFYN